ncbi:MAG: ECF transporter S component [Tissierellia bacterium]|nr:ECF transporter S component [Tissierellia bacterium]MDD4779628.1 ECF transporter S component [Tissierellia bacterium]
MNNRNTKTLELVQLALFAAIILLMVSVPYLGYIPLGFMNATIIHIPVIIGALFLGPKKGAILGFIFGLTSLFNNTFNPNVTSFVFSPFYTMGGVHGGIRSLIVCFVPRILIGVVAYYVYQSVIKAMEHKISAKPIAFAVAGVAGALTNTILVMSGIYFLFGSSYAAAKGLAIDSLYKLIFTVIGTQGIPEAIIAGVIVTAVGQVLYKFRKVEHLG